MKRSLLVVAVLAIGLLAGCAPSLKEKQDAVVAAAWGLESYYLSTRCTEAEVKAYNAKYAPYVTKAEAEASLAKVRGLYPADSEPVLKLLDAKKTADALVESYAKFTGEDGLRMSEARGNLQSYLFEICDDLKTRYKSP